MPDCPANAMNLPSGDQSSRSEEHTSELQSLRHLVCRLLLEKKNIQPALEPFAGGRLRGRLCSQRLPVIEIEQQGGTLRGSAQQILELAFFFKDTATTEIYPLSLPDALPI